MTENDQSPNEKAADDLRALIAEHIEGEEKAVVITDTADRKCELCGVVAELRPYGPNGERICFKCGMLDAQTTKARFAAQFGDA